MSYKNCRLFPAEEGKGRIEEDWPSVHIVVIREYRVPGSSSKRVEPGEWNGNCFLQ